MSRDLAKYSCDECRTRKIRCSRETVGCAQCKTEARDCIYSRSGMLRRKARQSKRLTNSLNPESGHASTEEFGASPFVPNHVRSQMDEDITTTQDALNNTTGPVDTVPSATLSSLDVEYTTFWQGPSLRDMARELGVHEKKFIAFQEQQAAVFTESLVDVQRKGTPLFTLTPPKIVHDAMLRPETVHEKAHLVIIYGILLTEVCLAPQTESLTITKLRWNLRLALDDARLLLEPCELNVQALMLLALHVQEVSTPSLCWMLLSNACRMLQALGVVSRKLDPETKDRRLLLFWTLAALDQHLALVFGRPPTFHPTAIAKMPLISMQRLLNWQPHVSQDENDPSRPFRSTFGAHIMRGMHSSSIVLSKIWSVLYDDGSKFDAAKKDLDEWYNGSISTLNACLLAEQPFLDAATQHSMHLGVDNLRFQYRYLKVLLIRSSPILKGECISSSREALYLLENLVSDSREVYNGVIWMLLYSPFTPFFILFGHTLSVENYRSKQQSLQAMEAMDRFLHAMKPRHPQAPKLQKIASIFVQHARSALARTEKTGRLSNMAGEYASLTHIEPMTLPADDPIGSTTTLVEPDMSEVTELQASQPLQDLFNDPSLRDLSIDLESWLPSTKTTDEYSTQMNGIAGTSQENNAYDFFADSTFDWFSWNPETMDTSSL